MNGPAAAGLEPVVGAARGRPAGSPPAQPLAGLAPSRASLWTRLAILGPGLIAAGAGNDAGGIASYSSAGARFGYDFLWVMLLLTVSLGLVQEMCARLAAATGRGLLDLVRERYGLGWGSFLLSLLLIANLGLTVSEFAGLGAASELLGASRYVVVPCAALLLWGMILFGSYAHAEKVFVLMTVVFFAYPVAAVMGQPDWGQVARGTFIPTFRWENDYLFLLVALLGTTITPFMQLFHQGSTVERGATRSAYGSERWDAYLGAIFSNLMSMCMIIATAATLYTRQGPVELESAAHAAVALEPVVGSAARIVFAVGLLGATLLAGAVVPLATAYGVAETFGCPKGVGLDLRRAPVFFVVFTTMLVVSAALALVPGLPLMPLLLWSQVLNGLILPVLLFFILRLSSHDRLMGNLKNSRFVNGLGWTTFSVVTLSVGAMLLGQALN